MDIGNAGGFSCPYCGARAFMSDSEFKGNDEFRKKLVTYYMAKAVEKENDYSNDNLWEQNGIVSFETENGMKLNIAYMDKYEYDKCVCYLAKESVVYVFEERREADSFMKGLGSLILPEADTKLPRSFPKLKTQIALKEGHVLAFERRPFFYPIEVFAPMPSGPLAWVISRMENVCCALEFSELSHKDITPSSFFINPITHEGALFGDWRKVSAKKNNVDLEALRKTALKTGENVSEPAMMKEFLESQPRKDAFEDFEYWDTVIEKGFGGHRFIKME